MSERQLRRAGVRASESPEESFLADDAVFQLEGKGRPYGVTLDSRSAISRSARARSTSSRLAALLVNSSRISS